VLKHVLPNDYLLIESIFEFDSLNQDAWVVISSDEGLKVVPFSKMSEQHGKDKDTGKHLRSIDFGETVDAHRGVTRLVGVVKQLVREF
jgi:hypothetical protein